MTAILDFVLEQRWAMDQRTLRSLVQIVQRHLDGVRLSGEQVDSIVASSEARARAGASDLIVRGGIGFVPIRGLIARHAGLVNGASQPPGTSVDAIRDQFRAALRDDRARAIVLDVDSPGGTAYAIPELAAEIRAARGRKPIVAHTAGMAASAAFWLAAQADRIVATRSAEVGSIGVYTVIDDMHRRYEQSGIDTHVLSTGPQKGLGVEGSRVTPAHLQVLQEGVTEVFGWFREAVQAGRGLTEEQFAAVADGRTWFAERAAELGLIDSIGSIEDVVEDLGGKVQKPQRRSRASAPRIPATVAEPSPSVEAEVRTASNPREWRKGMSPERLKSGARLVLEGHSGAATMLADLGQVDAAARELWASDPEVRAAFFSAADVAFALRNPSPEAMSKAAGSFLAAAHDPELELSGQVPTDAVSFLPSA